MTYLLPKTKLNTVSWELGSVWDFRWNLANPMMLWNTLGREVLRKDCRYEFLFFKNTKKMITYSLTVLRGNVEHRGSLCSALRVDVHSKLNFLHARNPAKIGAVMAGETEPNQ